MLVGCKILRLSVRSTELKSVFIVCISRERNIMDNAQYYPHHFLIAVSKSKNDLFYKSLVYLYQHNEDGACGIIINKKTSTNLGSIMEQLDIDTQPEITSQPVFVGGPLHPEHGFIIYPKPRLKEHADQVDMQKLDPLAVSPSLHTLQQIAHGRGPEKFIISLGYSGWSSGQLEEELYHNKWILAPYDETLLFDTPIDQRRSFAAQSVGFNINYLSSVVGHA